MAETEKIVDQLKRAFTGEAWHGPAVMEILDGITAQQAASRPVRNGHSIWELALHIGAWTGAVRSRLAGERSQLPDSEDWPAVTNISEQAWEQTKASLRQSYDDLGRAIRESEQSRLDLPIVEGMSSVYVTLHGVIQHSLYHAGQIALLKKALSEQERV